MAESYAVPKRPVTARVTLEGEEATEVVLFLAERAETHEGSERPGDLLARTQPFLPILDEHGSLALIGRDRIRILAIAAEEEPPPAAATVARVLLKLTGGAQVEGTVHYVMPEAQRRLQDFLNLPEPFVAVRQTSTVLFVNKNSILEARTQKRA